MVSKYVGTSPANAVPGLARHFERRPEHLFGTVIPEVIDASIVPKRKVGDLWLFQTHQLFAVPHQTFIGYGLPNAYIATHDGAGSFEKLAVKSLKRAPTTVDDTRDFVQAGVQLWLEDLPDEAREALRASMRKVVGEKFSTCVLGCNTVLEDAGFTCGDKPLTSYKMPSDILPLLVRNELKWRGQPLKVRVIRTSSIAATERFALHVRYSELSTFRRHAVRNLEQSARTNRMARAALYVYHAPANAISAVFDRQERKAEKFPIAPGLPVEGDYRQAPLSVSIPSRFGMMLRMYWGSHALFQVRPQGINIDDYLTRDLPAFPNCKDLATRLKKKVLFAKLPVAGIRHALCRDFVPAGTKNERDIMDALRTHSDENPNKYNLVVVGEGFDWSMTVARIGVGYGRLNGIVDWILSKHVLMTGWAKKVRFCGEIWKGVDGVLYVSGNSGTYQPTDAEVDAMVALLQAAMPNVVVRKAPLPGVAQTVPVAAGV